MDMSALVYIAITVLCYLVGLGAKAWNKIKDEWIPVIVGCVGVALGVLCFYIGVPDFPASDPVNAACIGAASGLAAVGVNQIGKQLGKLSE